MAWIKEIVMAGIITVIACAGIFELLERRKRAAFKEQIHDLAQKYIDKRINFNPPEHWEAVQDKRCNTSPLGRCSYLYKARRVKSLARSVHIGIAPHRGTKKNDVEQCKHTFKITAARCAPCSGYNVECKHYEGNDAADTKHCPR